MRTSPILALIFAAIPVSLANTIAWFGVLTFVNGFLIKELGHSDEVWTSVTLWFTGALIGWQLVSTDISAKIGRRATVVTAMLIAASAYLALSLTTNLFLIRICLMLVAFIIAAISAAWMPVVAAVGGERPGRALALYQIVAVSIGVVALVGSGRLITLFGYQRTFLLICIGYVVCALAFLGISRAFTRYTQVKVVSLRQVSKQDVLSLVRGPFLIVLIFGTCMEPYNYHTLNQLFPNIARVFYGLSEQHISEVVAIGRLAALFALSILTHFIDRISPLRCYGGGFMLAGVTILSMGHMTSSSWLIAAYFGYYLSHGAVWGSNLAAVNATVAPRLRDAAFALVSIIMLTSQFVTGLVHNRMLSAGLSLPAVFTWCGLVGTLAGGALFVYSFTAHSRRLPTQERAATDTPAPHGVAG